MEKFFENIHTAQDLFEALKEIPEHLREVLPLEIDGDITGKEWYNSSSFNLEAYEVRETEGCMERGFRITLPVEE